MTAEDMRALIDEARDWTVVLGPYDLIEALADALEAVLSPMPDEQLDEIEKRVAVATDGPWVADEFGYVRSAGKEAAGLGNFYPGDRGWAIFTAEGNYVEAAAYELADAEFVAHSREDVPALLAEVRRLRAWKADALAVFSEWEQTWQDAGRPGRLGGSKAVGVREEIARLRALSPAPDEQIAAGYTPHDHEVRARFISGSCETISRRDGITPGEAEIVAAAEWERWWRALSSRPGEETAVQYGDQRPVSADGERP